MASNKTGMRSGTGAGGASLGKALLGIVAIGVAGGAALVGGAKAFGEFLTKKQVEEYENLEKQREADREAARKIMESEPGEE